MKLLPLGILLFLFSCKNQSSAPVAGPAPATVITVETATTTTESDYTAAIEGKVNVAIRPQVEGYLDKVLVEEGAYVKAGQALFKINDRPYQEAINSARAQLNAAEANMQRSQLEIDKLTPLVQRKVIADIQLKTAAADFKAAQASQAQAKAQLAAAQINLDYTLIKAPVSGYIGRIPKKQGALISRADPEALTNLSDIHEVYAYFSMSENDFVHFKAIYPGTSLDEKLRQLPPVALLLADNSLYPSAGKIDMIDGAFNTNTGAITFRAVFANENGLIRSGNTGKVRLPQIHKDALLVPQAATLEIQDKRFVYVVDTANKVSKQAIEVSAKSGDQYLVVSGLHAGDRIVATGLDHLQEGMLVQPEAPAVQKELSLNK